MTVDPALFESDDSTAATPIAFGTLSGGETSAIFTKHLWNGKDDPTADTLSGLVITAYERQVVEDEDTGEVVEVTAWNQAGRATTERWVEARYTNGDGETTPWVEIGKGRWLGLDDLAAGEKWVLEFRMVVPGGSISSAEREIRIVTDWDSFARPVDLGHHESGKRGVLSGLGDGSSSHLVSGYEGSPSSPADADVTFSDGVAVFEGDVLVDLEHAVTFDATDGDAATLAAGEEYWATVTKDSSSGLTVTKSSKGAAPLADSERPAVPTGHILVAYVRRNEDATIEAGDIYQDDGIRELGRFALLTDGLNGYIQPGEALLDNRRISRTGVMVAPLTESVENVIWLDPSTGGLFVTDTTEDRPASRVMELWRVTTDASAETAREDRRQFIGAREVQVFRAGTEDVLAAADVIGHYYIPPGPGAWIRIPFGVFAALKDQGSSNTGGQTKFDLEYSESGGAWTTVFTSQGTAALDRRPDIAFDEANPVDHSALPEVVHIPGDSRLRAAVDEVPSGGTAPSGAVVIVILEIP